MLASVGNLARLVQSGVVSHEYAARMMSVSSCAVPSLEVQDGVTCGRAKCEHCGQWGDRFYPCSECGAPID